MLLTDSGAWQHALAHPKNKVNKHYWVQVEGDPDDAQLQALRNGVELKDGPASAVSVLPTLRLIRHRIGDYSLGNLQPGQWHGRDLPPKPPGHRPKPKRTTRPAQAGDGLRGDAKHYLNRVVGRIWVRVLVVATPGRKIQPALTGIKVQLVIEHAGGAAVGRQLLAQGHHKRVIGGKRRAGVDEGALAGGGA